MSRQAQVPMETRGAVARLRGRRRPAHVLRRNAGHAHGPFRARGDRCSIPTHQRTRRQWRHRRLVRAEERRCAARTSSICVASKLLDRPVKWIEDRTENLTIAGQARDERFDVEAAVDDAGNILGVRIEVVLDQGAYPLPNVGSKLLHRRVRVIFPSAYRIRDYEFDAKIVFTNKATYVAYRGPWAVETWVRERLLDRIARELGARPGRGASCATC